MAGEHLLCGPPTSAHSPLPDTQSVHAGRRAIGWQSASTVSNAPPGTCSVEVGCARRRAAVAAQGAIVSVLRPPPCLRQTRCAHHCALPARRVHAAQHHNRGPRAGAWGLTLLQSRFTKHVCVTAPAIRSLCVRWHCFTVLSVWQWHVWSCVDPGGGVGDAAAHTRHTRQHSHDVRGRHAMTLVP